MFIVPAIGNLSHFSVTTTFFFEQVAAHSNAIVNIDKIGHEMIREDHFMSVAIQDRLDELHRLWELLLRKLSEKGLRLQQALVR